ncbi:hypothetical protein MM326_02700 [Alkalihalobacillus sp. LMS6]|uniref:hypothetical protein n=1 Tax=Alkalihalobacillus sp. LMS6 TaxID=2924034 RepID=UPI0020D16FB4|nr:hypothetical protein [Alkalihalobacillus sp. LMS6]UTR06959.1 hypothetical protein MM326_02700 [Alkalihalobacillus sp. LMS6]
MKKSNATKLIFAGTLVVGLGLYPSKSEGKEDLKSVTETIYIESVYALPGTIAPNVYNETNGLIETNELTKEEYYKKRDSINTQNDNDRTETSLRAMSTTLSENNDGSYSIRQQVNWNSQPSNRNEDIIGVGVDNLTVTRGSESGSQQWIDALGNTGSEQYGESANWDRSGQGYGYSFNLLPTGNRGITEVVHFLSFDAELNNSSALNVSAYGQYAHLQESLSVTPSFSLSGASFSVSTVADWEYHPNTHASLSVN